MGTLAHQNEQHLGVSTWAMEAMLADSKATGCTEGWSTEFGSPYLDCPRQGPWENSSAHNHLPKGSDPTWRSQTWFDNDKSTKIKVAMARKARLGGVGAFTGEGAGYGKGADALWAALGSIADDTDQGNGGIRAQLKTDDGTPNRNVTVNLLLESASGGLSSTALPSYNFNVRQLTAVF